MLGLIRSEGEVGYYSNAAKLIRLSLVVPMALNLVISPQLSGSFALKDSQRSREILNQAVSWIIYLSLPICTLYLLYADQLIQLFAGDQFNPSIPLMRWMAGIPLFISLSNLFIYYGLFGLDRALKYRMVLGVVAGIFISILLNLWLIPLYGATGAAINSFIIELGFMVLFALWIKPIFKWTAHLKSLITCLLFLPVYFMIMQAPWNVLSKLMIGGISSVLIYLLMQHYVWKHPMPRLYSSNFNTARNAS
jgi:O-antigen/teichoic acid export membrane protein